jgi:hypothetical protein
MDGSGVDFGDPTAYREFTGCEDGGGVMVSCDMEDSMVGRVADGAPTIEMDADKAGTLSWLAGKLALVGLGVEGESEGLDMPSKEPGEAIIVRRDGTGKTAILLSHVGIQMLRE